MTTDTPEATAATAPLPDRSVVPAVWGRITNLTVDRGEGSWLSRPTAHDTSTTPRGSA